MSCQNSQVLWVAGPWKSPTQGNYGLVFSRIGRENLGLATGGERYPLRGPGSPRNRVGGIGARRRPGKRGLPDKALEFLGNLVTGWSSKAVPRTPQEASDQVVVPLHVVVFGNSGEWRLWRLRR